MQIHKSCCETYRWLSIVCDKCDVTTADLKKKKADLIDTAVEQS